MKNRLLVLKKKLTAVPLLVMLICMALLVPAFAATGDTEDADEKEQKRIMEQKEAIDKILKEHPEYEEALNEIYAEADTIINEELEEAFKRVQKSELENFKAVQEKYDIPQERMAVFAGFLESFATLLNKDFTAHYAYSFNNSLLGDKLGADSSNSDLLLPDYRLTYEALREGFCEYVDSIGKMEETTKALENLDEKLLKEIENAYNDANSRLKGSYNKIAGEYGFSNEDKELIAEILTASFEDINNDYLDNAPDIGFVTLLIEEDKDSDDQDEAQSEAIERQFDEMVDVIDAFEDEHPEYKDAWYEIMESMQDIHMSALHDAFDEITEAEQQKKAEVSKEKDIDKQKARELDAIIKKVEDLMNRDIMSRSEEMFGIFDKLADDGEFDIDTDDSRDRLKTEPVTEEEIQAVLDEYNEFFEENPDAVEAEKEALAFKSEVIAKALSEAHAKSKADCKAMQEEVYEKYQIPEEDRETISEMISLMVHQINDSFENYLASNPFFAPLADELSKDEKDEKDDTELAQQLDEMAETLHEFDDEHPEYKDAWYEIIDLEQDCHMTAFKEAFDEIDRINKENEKKAIKEHGDSAKELAEIEDKMMDIINRSTKTHIREVFEVFDYLASDGDFSYYDDSRMAKENIKPVTKEEVDAVLKEYDAFKKANPDFAEREEKAFKNRNKYIVDELGKAHNKAKAAWQEGIKDIYEKYDIPKKDQDAIDEMHSMLTNQINENFVEYVESMDLFGKLSLKPSKTASENGR